MIKNVTKFIGTKVYENETGNYLGKISDVAFSSDGKIKGYYMASDSIVPLRAWIFPSSVTSYKKGKVYVNNVSDNKNDYITFKKNVSRISFFKGNKKIGVGRDMLFDFEMGEIEGFLYSENIFKSPSYLELNKIKINGKNINIEN